MPTISNPPAPAATSGSLPTKAQIDELYKTLGPELKRQMDIDPKLDISHCHVIERDHSIQLKTVPAWLVAVPTIAPPHTFSHLFVLVGDPGKGDHSGIQYYSISSDTFRGTVSIDEAFMTKANALAEKDPVNGKGMLAALSKMPEKSYSSREQFYVAYRNARASAGISHEAIHEEIKKLYTLVPNSQMEMWLREANGKSAEKPNLAERDIRSAEDFKGFEKLSDKEILSGKTHQSKEMNIRRVDVDPLKLLEVKRDALLQRLYIDEIHNRDGSGVPPGHEPAKRVSSEDLLKVALATGKYKYIPPFTPLEGNCSSGAAAILRQAGAPADAVLAPSDAAFGLTHEFQTWNPVKDQTGPAKPKSGNNAIDTSSLRGGEIDTSALKTHLLNRAERLAPEKDLASKQHPSKL